MSIRCISNSSFIGAQSFTRLLGVTIKGIFLKSDAFSLTRALSITLFQIRQDTSLAAAIFLFPSSFSSPLFLFFASSPSHCFFFTLVYFPFTFSDPFSLSLSNITDYFTQMMSLRTIYGDN